MATVRDDETPRPSDDPDGLPPELAERVYELLLDAAPDRANELEALCRSHPSAASAIRRLTQEMSVANRLLPPPQPSPATVPLHPHTKIADYELMREVGRGGMGVVFEARQPSLRRTVALKLLPTQHTWSEQAVARFQREGASAARLQHRGIVEVHATGEAGGHHYLAMEFVEGAPLSAVLNGLRGADLAAVDVAQLRATIVANIVRPSQDGSREQTSPPPSRSYLDAVVEIAKQVAEALDHAHQAGVVHRDVKPSNIMICENGRAVLTDFGLARDEEQPALTRTGAFAGTPHYASPEQARGDNKAIDRRSDVFSLGATLYEMITLRLPFGGDGTQQVLERIQRSEPKDPSRQNPQVRDELAAIVLKALDKDPARRYQTAGAFAADLGALLELRPVSARRASTLRRTRRWVRREPILAGLLTALAIGVPTVSVLTGIWIANAPKVALAERQEQLEHIEELLTRAQLQSGGADLSGAIATYERILASWADHPEALAGLAYLTARSGQPAAALALLDDALAASTAPSEPPAARRVRLWVLDQLDRPADADALRATIGEPTDPFELLLMAEEQWRIGSDTADSAGQSRALALMQAAVRSTARARPWIHSRLAMHLGMIADPEAARSMARSLERLWPDRILTLQAVALALYIVAPDEALVAAERALARRPEMSSLHRVRAVALQKAKRFDEAEAAYRECLRLNPGDEKTHELLGDLYYFCLRRYDDCLREVERAIELAPTPQKPLWLKAHALKRLGRLEESLAAWQHLTEVHPNYANAFNNLADVAYQLDKPKLALTAALRAVEINPRYTIGLSTLAGCWEASGNPAKAIETLERAVAVAPNDQYNWRELVRMHLSADTPVELRDAERAVQAARQQYRINDSLTVQVGLGRALIANGDHAEAKRLLTGARAKLVDHPHAAAKALLEEADALLVGLR